MKSSDSKQREGEERKGKETREGGQRVKVRDRDRKTKCEKVSEDVKKKLKRHREESLLDGN